ncbi:MAG: flagellar hook-associated protein FlgL [Gaiellales bacterium]
MTRVTQSMISRTLLADLHDVADRLARTQRKLSSGKELERPSDNPYGVSRALQLRDELGQTRQYRRNAAEVNSWQTVADTALRQVADHVLRARELLVQGATDTASPEARQAIATEITQLIDAIKTEGNARLGDRFVFAGSATLTSPYQLGANDGYAGNAEIVRREIGPGVQIDLNVVGQQVIGDDTSGLLSTLRQIVTDLQAGDTNALGTTDIQALDTALDTVTTSQAVVGARQNRLESANERLAELEENAAGLLSETEDADMAETLVHFSMQRAVYESALKAGSEIIQPSLMDFLR